MPKFLKISSYFVKQVLNLAYSGRKNSEEKVNASPLAPWLIKIILDKGGMENLGSEDLKKINSIA